MRSGPPRPSSVGVCVRRIFPFRISLFERGSSRVWGAHRLAGSPCLCRVALGVWSPRCGARPGGGWGICDPPPSSGSWWVSRSGRGALAGCGGGGLAVPWFLVLSRLQVIDEALTFRPKDRGGRPCRKRHGAAPPRSTLESGATGRSWRCRGRRRRQRPICRRWCGIPCTTRRRPLAPLAWRPSWLSPGGPHLCEVGGAAWARRPRQLQRPHPVRKGWGPRSARSAARMTQPSRARRRSALRGPPRRPSSETRLVGHSPRLTLHKRC